MRHIIKPLMRQRLMPLLVVLQTALACAIACNALFLLQQKLAPILTPDGVGQPDHLLIVDRLLSHGKPWPVSRLRGTEMALRALPGVAAVSMAGSLPMETNAKMSGTVLAADSRARANSAVYIGDHLVDTLRLKLVAGRDFSAEEEAVEYHGVGINASGPTIITRALANKLFPGESALRKVIRVGKKDDAARRTVVGIVAHLMRNDFGDGHRNDLDDSMLMPGIPNQWPMPAIGVRLNPNADSGKVSKAVGATIQRLLGEEMVKGITPRYQTYAQLRGEALAKSRAAVWLLAGVCVIVLIVTLAGIMGLTSYWVGQRTRQIGIRRALGARRRHILHDLQWENLLVVGLGVALGLMAAYGINLWLMHHYELARLPWQYLPFGAALLLILGQLAVLWPAIRAARVPPVVATRSV